MTSDCPEIDPLDQFERAMRLHRAELAAVRARYEARWGRAIPTDEEQP